MIPEREKEIREQMTAKKKITTRLWRPKKFTGDELLKACEDARKEEREACTKIADEECASLKEACINESNTIGMGMITGGMTVAWRIAQAIRARGVGEK